MLERRNFHGITDQTSRVRIQKEIGSNVAKTNSSSTLHFRVHNQCTSCIRHWKHCALSRVDTIVLVLTCKRLQKFKPRTTNCNWSNLHQHLWSSKSLPYRKQHPAFTMTLQKKRSDHTFLDHYEDEFSIWCIKCLKRQINSSTNCTKICNPPWLKTLKNGPAPGM